MSVALRVAETLACDIDVDALSSRRQPFDFVHLGMREIEIGTVLELLHSEPDLLPPRTGHLGNWEDIALGRAGAIDFNQAICRPRYGYPLIYSFTQTEADGQRGDWVYLPGSIVSRGCRTALPLYTWDGARFARRDRTAPLFCPFVQAWAGGRLQPLVELHWKRMQSDDGFDFELEAQTIVDQAGAIRPMLLQLIADACARPNSTAALSDLISHSVARDGRMTRCHVVHDDHTFVVGGHRYASADSLVDAAMIPFRAVTDPAAFVAQVAELPPVVPVLSTIAVAVLTAVFATHFPRLPRSEIARVTRPFNTHLHWGARDMAGYPPRQRGYFSSKATLKSLRWICESLVRAFPEVDPVCFVLLPASVFMLCPTSAYARDVSVVTELFQEVAALPDANGELDQTLAARVEATTRVWFGRREKELSRYFINRFRRNGAVEIEAGMATAVPVEPDCFRALTFRRACMIVGAFAECVAEAR